MILFLQQNPFFFIGFVAILGLIVGSFLNVVIYRIPLSLENDWRKQCHDYLNIPLPPGSSPQRINLLFPPSHCPNCKQPLRAWQNIPLISYLLLLGKCHYCKQRISWRYPSIELLTAAVSLVSAWFFGPTWLTLIALLFSWTLICLSAIDIKHQLLPDNITLPFLWLGLLFSLTYSITSPYSAILGAFFGYSSLWLIANLFKLISGKEGLGQGDFKLFAAIGAWLGWQLLPLVLLIAAFLGSCISLGLILSKKRARETPFAFGPYLALGAWISFFVGNTLILYYLSLLT